MNTKIPFHNRLFGEFRIVVNQGKDSESDTGWRKNLVLDTGLDRIGSGNAAFFNYCCVGTGTTAPANSQSSLASYLASQVIQSSDSTNLGSPSYASQYNSVYTFAQGAVVGNISEFGVGWGAGGSGLFSRCLIVDNSGSPSTITLTSIDQLTVYYRLTVTPSLTDVTGSFVLNSTSYSYTARHSNINTVFLSSSQSFNNWVGGQLGTQSAVYGAGSAIGSITSNPSGTGVGAGGAVSRASYTPGTFYSDATISIPDSIGNPTGGIAAMTLNFAVTNNNYGVANIQYGFSPVIPKDSTSTLTFTVRTSWSR